MPEVAPVLMVFAEEGMVEAELRRRAGVPGVCGGAGAVGVRPLAVDPFAWGRDGVVAPAAVEVSGVHAHARVAA